MSDEKAKKQPCPDCAFCQWCSDERCRLCLGHSGGCRRKKLSLSEQIRLYDSLNPAPPTPEEKQG